MVQARDVLRMPFGQRWGEDCIRWGKWVQWHRYKGDDRADGDLERRKRRSKRGKGESGVYRHKRQGAQEVLYIIFVISILIYIYTLDGIM